MGILDTWTKKKPTAAKPKTMQGSVSATDTEVVETKESSMIPGKAEHVILRPVLSEKVAMAEAAGTYTFVVRNDANKIQIKQAIAAVYGVMPAKVRMLNREGKQVRFGRSMGRRAHEKRALVTLPKGKTIQVHTGV